MIYVASPYTHPRKSIREKRYLDVQKYTAYLLKCGYICFSPVAHSHPISERFSMPKDFEFWQKNCLALLSCCDEIRVLKLKGWNESKGVLAEIEYAQQNGITVTYADSGDYSIE